MKKRKEKLNISNRLAYFLIGVSVIILLGIGVYAYDGGTPSVMGHTANELTWPSCAANQVLSSGGGAIGCKDSVDSRFTITPSGLCYDAPASCGATTSETCYWYYEITGYHCSEFVDYSNICAPGCEANRPPQSCVGDTTYCSGGTTSVYTKAVGNCYVLYQDQTGDSIDCFCYGNNYQLEHVNSAGQRCV